MPPPPADDYYALLGLHEGADGATLRSAWRRLASRYHPDRAGDGATTTFQQLSAAYEVLSDPIARAAYDRRRRRAGAPVGAGAAHCTGGSTGASTTRPSPAARPPAPAVMLSRLCGPLASLIACGAARLDDDDDDGFITLVLGESEAARGGMAAISMRVALRCPACAAQGAATNDAAAQARSAACAGCGGTRTVDELFSAWLAVRPGTTSGQVLTPSVELPGMLEPVRFRVDVRGAPQARPQ